ncbi:LamG-like jellyroll fold domain-containing protein [Streptomyces albidoflavus]
MAVLAGTEQVALAYPGNSPGSGESAPDQMWGTAAGRSHRASADATSADGAAGGRSGHQQAPDEVSGESRPGMTVLDQPSAPPEPAPVEVVDAPSDNTPQGLVPERSEELPEERGERERTYRNPDGTLTTRFYTEPVHFKDAEGEWKEIDTDLVPRTAARGARAATAVDPGWETESTSSPVVFAATADADPLVTLGVDGARSIAYAVHGARPVQGETSGSTVLYREVREGADIELVAGGSSVKETVILKDRNAPTEWRFPLRLEGLSAADDGSGGVVFTDAAGVQRAWMPPGWMQEAPADGTTEGEVSSGVSYRLVEEDGRQELVMTLDEEWLAAPGRAFPVRVDPSVKSFNATSGTYVQHPYNQNFASDTVLKVGTYDGGAHKAAAFLRFNGVESTLKNAWVLGANLALYNTWSQSCTARPVTVHPVTSNWSETTTTKYPGPATGASLASKSFAHGWRPEGTTSWACGPAWESIKLGSAGRKLVDDWTHGKKKNYGLAVKASTTDSKGWKQFGSDDYPNGKPSLDITWTKYGATYKLGDFTAPVTATTQGVQKLTLTNRGQETWPKAGKYKLRYNLYDSKGKEITDSSKMAYTEMPKAVSPGDSVTVDAKIAPLPPAEYTVQWTMTDYGVSRFTTAGVSGPAIKLASVNIPPQLTAEVPASGVTVDSLTPTLWAQGKDADSYPKAALQYTFEVCEVEGGKLRQNCRKGERSGEQQWAVPSGWLTWGKSYAWYAYAYDGAATSARPGAALFTTQVPQPTVTGHLGGPDSGKEIGSRVGNYVTSAVDAAVTTVGPELAVNRTYNSLDPREDGAFGGGWSTRWDMRLREEPATRSVLVTLADGAQVRFGKDGDGHYSGPPGGALTLEKSSPGWILRERSGSTHQFDADGRLTLIKDSTGREQRLAYSQEDGLLARATDSLSGRSLSFIWDNGRVTSVSTDPVGPGTGALTWTYGYTDDHLTEVCAPGSQSACTRYTYAPGSLYRSAVLDAAPHSYWRLGEEEGATAASEAVSPTGLNDASYRDVRLGETPAVNGADNTAAWFDGTDSAVELPRQTFQAAAYPTVEVWFRTETAGGVLVAFQNAELGDTPTSYRPVLNIDVDGKLRGEFRRTGVTGASGPITSDRPVTDNTWHHAVLTASADGQTLYLDGQKVGSIAGTVSEQARDHAYLGAGYASASWMGVSATGEYRFKGQLDEVAVYHHPLDAATVAEHYAARAAARQLTQVTLPSGRKHAQATYDQDTGRLTDHTDANGGTWQVSAPAYSNSSSAYATTVQRSRPTGYWRLGDRLGAQAESPLGEELAGSYLSGSRPGAPGIFRDGDDTAASFDGEGAVEVPSEGLGAGTEMSVELWFRTTEPGGVLLTQQNGEFGDTPTGWRPMLLIDADGILRGKFTPDATSMLSKEPVTDGQWHHVLLTGNEAIQLLFVDGVYQSQSRSPVTTVRHPKVFVGGGYASSGWDGQTGGYRNFRGDIDEVAFYDKPLALFRKFPVSAGHTWVWMPLREKETAAQRVRSRTEFTAGSAGQYHSVVAADSPAAHWRLSEEEGAVLSSEAGGRDMAATYRPGEEDAALISSDGAFGRGDDTAQRLVAARHIETPGDVLAGSADVSVETWFRTEKHSGVLFGFQNAPLGQTPTSWRPVLNIDGSGKLRGEFRQQGVTAAQGPVTTPEAVTDGKWHHVVLSGNAEGQTLYLDGAKVGSIKGPISDQSRPYAYLGAGYSSSSWMGTPSGTYYFDGYLDEPALYRHALTAEQVSAHYRAQAEPVASGLTSTVTVTDPGKKTSSTSYDALRGQRVISRTDATGAVTSYGYDHAGAQHSVTDPNGHTTVTGHDARGNTVSTTTCRDADSCWTSYRAYHLNPDDPLDPRNDKLLSFSDQRSRDHKDDRYRLSYSYDARGLPTDATRADGSRTTTAYTTGTEEAVGGGAVPPGLVATQESPEGGTTSYRYHSSGDLAEVVSPSGLTTRYTYDGVGRKISETQVSDTHPDGVTTSYAYDAASHVVTERGAKTENTVTKEAHRAEISRSYDEDGRLLQETVRDLEGEDAERVTAYGYDAHGLNNKVTDPAGRTTRHQFDAFGRVRETTDPAGNRTSYAYTSRGELAETKLHDWTGDPIGTTRDLVTESRAYDPAGRLASTTDAMGATTEYRYFDDGLTAKVSARQVVQADGSRRDVTLEENTYDPAGHLTHQVTGGGKTERRFTVDALGRTTRTVLDPEGLDRVTALTYDAEDRLTQQREKITDDSELTHSWEYDAAGNPLRRSVTDGTSTHITTATYDQRGLLLSSVTPRGNEPGAAAADHTSTYVYDELGRLVRECAPEIATEENGEAAKAARPTILTGYNAYGEPTESRDPQGHVTHTAYDQAGQPVAVESPSYTRPDGETIEATTRTAYTPLGLPQSVTDPLGRVTRYGYDQFGNLSTLTEPAADPVAALLAEDGAGLLNGPASDTGGGVHRFTWTPTGLQLSATDPNGARTEATYDELGRRLTGTTVERFPEPQALTSRYTWDDAGNPTKSSTPAGRVTTAAHNAAGDTVSVTTPAGTTTYTHDGLGRTTSTTDATGRKSTTAFDALGNPTTVADFGTGDKAARTTSASYDADGNQVTATSATGARTEFVYDALGRLTKQREPVDADRAITSEFGYDAAGRRTRMTDGRGNTTTYTFTPWGLPESTVEPATDAHPAAADRTWTTLYDAAGQDVVEILPGGVRRERSFDGMGRLTSESGSGAEATTTARAFTYDLAGRMTSAGSGTLLTPHAYTYNDRGHLLAAEGPAGRVSYAYDVDGNMTERTDPKNTTSYGYDAAGRIEWLWNEMTGADIWYEFDAAGRPLMEQYAVQPEGSDDWVESARRSYTYDDLGRLTGDRITSPDRETTTAATTYDYDLDDRLTGKETEGTAGAGTHSYAYDRSGRLTSWTAGGTTTNYAWDDAGNRIRSGAAESSYDERNRLTSDGDSAYRYSARGSLTTVTMGGTARELTFDAFERKVADSGSSFSYDSLDRIASHNGKTFLYDGGSNDLLDDGTSHYSRTPAGALIGSATGSSAQWSVTDRHTDVVAGLSVEGDQVTSSTAYDPFGRVTAAEGTTPALGYQSGWTDPAGGDVNMAARWYQPGTGAFASRDTWLLDPSPSAQANRHLYGNGDPLNSTDPSGHIAFVIPVIAGLTGSQAISIGAATTAILAGAAAIDTWRRNLGSSVGGSTYTGTSVWSNAFPDTASAVRAQAGALSRGGGNPGYTYAYMGPWRAATPGATYYPGWAPTRGWTGSTTVRAVAPPKPPIDQNPNNGPNPVPAPARPKPKIDWIPGSGGWKPSDAINMVFGAAQMLQIINNGQYTPSQTGPSPQPTTPDAGQPGTGLPDDDPCDMPRGVRFQYGPLVSGAPTGAQALICPADLKKPGSRDSRPSDFPDPPGWISERESSGNSLNYTFHRSHIIADRFNGEWIKQNVFTGYREMNTPNMSRCERRIADSLKKKNPVLYSAKLEYSNGTNAMPTGITLSAENAHGHIFKDVYIPNKPGKRDTC